MHLQEGPNQQPNSKFLEYFYLFIVVYPGNAYFGKFFHILSFIDKK